MHVSSLYPIFLKFPIISTDTRKITPGCLFFALKGTSFNGNKFARQAIESGAEFAITDEDTDAPYEKIIRVENVLETLQALAAWHRKELNIPVLAIVGSNGKTTTKELLTSVLSQKFNVLSTPGNFNNHIGLPLTLLMLNPSHQLAVIEMGANHEKENALLCSIASPSHGIVTNNGKDHLEGFGSIEGVIRSNAELYDYLAQYNGIAFVNASDNKLMETSARVQKRITYSIESAKIKSADYLAEALQLQPEIRFKVKGNNTLFESPLSGDYNLENIMAAVSAGFHFGLTEKEVFDGVKCYEPKNLRSQLIQKESNRIFLDAYNANPSSMEVSIRNFAAMEGQNKILILGDMFELGQYEAEEHKHLSDYCRSLNLQDVYLVGKAFAATPTNYTRFTTTEEAAKYFKTNPIHNSFIFLKGSRGMKLEQLVDFF